MSKQAQNKSAEQSPIVPPDYWLDIPRVYRAKRKHLQMLGLLDMKPDGLVVLDAGCGAGAYSIILAQEGFKVIGVDIVVESINKAKEIVSRQGLSFQPMVGDIEALSFQDNTFDVVFTGWVLHHFPSLDKVCAELCRVLKPGGRIAIVEPNEANLAMRFSRFIENLFYSISLKIGLDTPNRETHYYGDYLKELRKGGIKGLKYSSCFASLPLLLHFRNFAVGVLFRAVVRLRAGLFHLCTKMLPRPLNGQDLLIVGAKKK